MIELLKATAEKAELIAKIGKQSFLDSHGHCASKEEVDHFISKTYTTQAILNELKQPEFQYHIIYFNKEAAGFSKIELNTIQKDIKDLNVSKLDRLYLLKKFYGQNLASSLLDFLVQLSKNNGQQGLWLATWVENKRAISFYKKKGFKIVGKYDFKISETLSNPNHIMYLKY